MAEEHPVHPDDDGRELSDFVIDPEDPNKVSEEKIHWSPSLRFAHFEFLANEYKYKRAEEYPSVVDQLDSIYHKGVEGWKAEIQKIKDKYPKPEST